MKKLLLLVCFGLLSLFALSQNFVNSSNLWYIEECCADVSNGTVSCYTYEYKFADPIEIDGLTYSTLIANNSSINIAAGLYYREDNGKVFMRYNQNFSEVLIYDFNLEVGETVAVGDAGSNTELVVIGVDSIELLSGEKRKRLELEPVSNSNLKAFWIEGIGSLTAPMDTRYMFSFDCWVELVCYFVGEDTQYSLKECLLTNSTKEYKLVESSVDVFPNPVEDILNVRLNTNQNYKDLNIFDAKGVAIQNLLSLDTGQYDISNLSSGIYFLLVTFSDGKKEMKKFVKN